jgi:hypothetical protein
MATKKAGEMNMKAFLGAGIQVHSHTDDWAFYFKPMEFITGEDRDNDRWIGQDDQGAERVVHRHEIDFIVYR